MPLDGNDRLIRVGDRLPLGRLPDKALTVFENPTTEGVVRPPSALGMTTASSPSMKATHELVVPRSIPITLPIDDIPPFAGDAVSDSYLDTFTIVGRRTRSLNRYPR